MRNLIEWVAVIVGAVLVAVLIKTFLVQAFRIPSESMVSTLEVGDRVLVNKLSYRAHDINRGDVVVFTRPPGLPAGPGEPEDLIKRVIGVPGDTLQAKEGLMYVNGKLLEEPYLPAGTSTVNLDKTVTIQEGQAWVMGDNRNNSQDSRVFGPIETDSVIGRAFTIMWPPGRISSL
jgi:signal peptidase I